MDAKPQFTFEFPTLCTSREFREHTRGSILHPRHEDLKRMELLLDEYHTLLLDYRRSCEVREHGFTAVKQLQENYVGHVERREFQRRYCVERACWEPGLNLEEQALTRLQNLAFIDVEQAQLLRDAARHLFHQELIADRDEQLGQMHLRWRRQEIWKILERAGKDAAGKSALTDLKRAETLMRENAASGEWLAGVCETHQAEATLRQMQQALAQTEKELLQINEHLDKKRQHLAHHLQQVQTSHATVVAKLLEVCRYFHKLRMEHWRDLSKRDQDGFLWRMQQSMQRAEDLIARNPAAHPPYVESHPS